MHRLIWFCPVSVQVMQRIFRQNKNNQAISTDWSCQVNCSALLDSDHILQGVLVSFEVPVKKDRRQASEQTAVSPGQHAMVHLSHEIRFSHECSAWLYTVAEKRTVAR